MYAQRNAYPTEQQPAYYTRRQQQPDRYRDDRYRPMDQRRVEGDRDRGMRSIPPTNGRYVPNQRPPQLREAYRGDQFAQGQRRDFQQRRDFNQGYYPNEGTGDYRPRRFEPVGYRQDLSLTPNPGQQLLNTGQRQLQNGAQQLQNQARGAVQERLPTPRPIAGQDRPLRDAVDSAVQRNQQPALNPTPADQRPVDPRPVNPNGGSAKVDPYHPAPTPSQSNGYSQSHSHAPSHSQVAPPSHPANCGCSSCSSGGYYEEGSGSYGCDDGCGVVDDRRYDRYFQPGRDRFVGRCRKGLCGGCSSCLGGRVGRKLRNGGGCLGRCGKRGGCGGGCGVGGYDDCGVSDYEYKFYGSRPRKRLLGGCLSGGCSSGGCDSDIAYGDSCGPIDDCGPAYDNVYTVVGASWLLLERDGADFYALSYENPMPNNRIFVDSADQSAQNGVEIFFARQRECGNGWELRYWGIYENEANAYLGNMPRTELGGFTHVNYPGVGTVQSLYDIADFHGVRRDSQLHNMELNIFRIASGCGPRGRFVLRGLGGFRVINFQDEMDYHSYHSGHFGSTFNKIEYQLDTNNTILATQLGATGEYCISPRLRLSMGAKAGIGANLIRARQQIVNNLGAFAKNTHGHDFCYHNEDTDLSAFGELNTALLYHVSDSFRVRFGYRMIGFTGIALAYDQIPYDFTDTQELQSVKRDGSLFYHGLQVGGEYCY